MVNVGKKQSKQADCGCFFCEWAIVNGEWAMVNKGWGGPIVYGASTTLQIFTIPHSPFTNPPPFHQKL